MRGTWHVNASIVVLAAAAHGACGFELAPGATTDAPFDDARRADAPGPSDDAPEAPTIDAAMLDASPPGPIVHLASVNATSSQSSSITSPSIAALGSGRVFATTVLRNNTAIASINGLGVTWSRVANPCGGEGKIVTEVWTATGPTTAGSVTVTFPVAATQSVIVVSTYSHTGPLGAMTTRNSAPNGTSCGTDGWETTSYSTQLANQSTTGLVYLALGKRSESHTPGAAYTERNELATAGTNAAGVAIADRPVIAGPTPITGSFANSEEWALVAVELR